MNAESLIKKGILRLKKGRNPQVKILSDGEITKKIIIDGCAVSLKAKEKIEKAGGEVRLPKFLQMGKPLKENPVGEKI